MAQIIKSISQLQNALDKYAAYATDKMADEVKKKIEEFIKYYYQEYTPEQYSRVWNFLNSVVKTDVYKRGDTWYSEVYIDTSITYKNNWTMEGTAIQANNGLHGWYHPVQVGDSHFWNDAIEEIHSPEFVNKFADFLRSKGLKVTIK